MRVEDTSGETELEMAHRHVREGERHIALQKEIISWLSDHGNQTDQAVRLLANIVDMQRMHLQHLARIDQAY